MKQIAHYFPFFVLTALLYGWFFYQHNQATIITPSALNSGQQVVQLQLVEMQQTTESKVKTESEVQAENQVTAHSKVQAESNVPAQSKAAAESETQAVPAEQRASAIQSTTPSKIKIADQTRAQATQETVASRDARLKAELFEADFHLDLPAPPATKKTAKNKPPEMPAVNSKKVKTMRSAAPSVASKILQEQQKPKHVFKKQRQLATNQGVLQEAIVVSGNKPIYPQRAILRSQQGRVVVKLTVTTKGKTKDAEILTSSGHAVLDDAVLDFVNKELFMPAHQGEEKITTQQIFSFRFELK